MRRFQKIMNYIKTNFSIISLTIVLLSIFIIPVVLNMIEEKQSKLLTNYENVCVELVKLSPAKASTSANSDIKKYAFNIDNQLIILNRSVLYDVIYNYIQQNVVVEKRNDNVYISKLTNSYIDLMDTEDPNTVLRFIGLCKIESCFSNKIISSAGAYGIGQVMLKIWYKVMRDNWNVSIEEYKKDINKQIIVAYKIYSVYLKKNKNNVVKAHAGYSGGARGYHNKVMKQYDILKRDVKKVASK